PGRGPICPGADRMPLGGVPRSGRIDRRRPPGAGFRVELSHPLSSTMSDEVIPHARLLVVDDQETNLQLLGGMLGQMGFDIVLASDGEQALQRLERNAVDLILLDVLLPGIDGFEVCRRIRARPEWVDIPVIFLSAADEKNLIVRALEVGGVDYVTKPFNQAELMSRVRTQLALKTARDHLRWLAEDKDELLGVLAHDLKNHL